MNVLKKILLLIYLHLAKQTQEANHQITLFAIVMMINFPLFGVLWRFERFQVSEEFFLRLIATFLCVLLATHQVWPKAFLKFFPCLWYLTLLYCLPFFFAYLTLLNHGATLWLMNCVSAVFFLLLVTPLIDAICLIFSGVCFACSFYYASGQILEYFPGYISLYSLITTFAAAIIIGALFTKELIQTQRLYGRRWLLNNLVSENPNALANLYLPPQLEDLIGDKLNHSSVNKNLKEALDTINPNIQVGNQLLSMQLKNNPPLQFNTHNFSIHSLPLLLERALDEYPFQGKQKSLINTSLLTLFSVWIEELAFKNLIWNLLRNSLQTIENKGEGEIKAWLYAGEEKDDFNYLHIKTIAKSPQNSEKTRINASAKKLQGTKREFIYYRLLMKAAGGDLCYEAKADDYAHFILKFPKID